MSKQQQAPVTGPIPEFPSAEIAEDVKTGVLGNYLHHSSLAQQHRTQAENAERAKRADLEAIAQRQGQMEELRRQLAQLDAEVNGLQQRVTDHETRRRDAAWAANVEDGKAAGWAVVARQNKWALPPVPETEEGWPDAWTKVQDLSPNPQANIQNLIAASEQR